MHSLVDLVLGDLAKMWSIPYLPFIPLACSCYCYIFFYISYFLCSSDTEHIVNKHKLFQALVVESFDIEAEFLFFLFL
jgi:hypothetical protein